MSYPVDYKNQGLSYLTKAAERLGVGDLPGVCSHPEAQFFLFGRDIVSGGMCVLEDEAYIEAFLLAETERAARDLLSWFPPDRDLLLHIPQDWFLDRSRFQFDLEPAAGNMYKGRRRNPGLPQGVSEFHAKVDSQKHPAVDRARALQSEKGRDELGLYAAHGPLLLSRAVSAKAPLEYVLYTPKLSSDPDVEELLSGLQAHHIPHYLITEGLMRKCVDTAYVPAVLSVLRKQAVRIDDLHIGPHALAIVSESVEEAGNLGMILRTADAAAADAVMVCGSGADPYAWKTVTGSRGSVFRVPLVVLKDSSRLLSSMKEKGITLITADLSGDRSHFKLDYTSSTAFLVGNESEGLSPEALELSDIRVRIPMPGEPDSLNVGVSAGVLLYEALRQRMGMGDG